MVERAITPRTKVIILNSPNNPSGAVMNPEDMTSVLRLAHERGIYVISDECYVYLNYTGRLFSAGSVHEVKERLHHYWLAVEDLRDDRMAAGLCTRPGAPSQRHEQTAEPEHLESHVDCAEGGSGGAEWPAGLRERDAGRNTSVLRDQVVDGLRAIPGITCAAPNGAFYAYPNVSHYFGRGGMNSASDVARRLLHEAHVVVVPGEGFGTQEHVRLSYAVADEKLAEGLERMRKFFASV